MLMAVGRMVGVDGFSWWTWMVRGGVIPWIVVWQNMNEAKSDSPSVYRMMKF